MNSVGFWIAAVVSVSRSLSRSESPQFLQIGVEMAQGGGHGLLAGFIGQVTFGGVAFPTVISARWSRSTRRSSPSWTWSRVGGIGVDLGRGLRLAELWLCLALKAPAALAAANPRLVCSSSFASSSTQYSWLTSAAATSARARSRYFPCRSTCRRPLELDQLEVVALISALWR